MKYIALILLSILLISTASATDSACEELTYCTQTMGGWSSPESGENVGDLRDTHWDDAVGGDLVIGTGFEMIFTGPEHVENYLPEGGSNFVLAADETNPSDGSGSNLHGQLTALQLNILFSEAGIGKIGSQSSITDHLITSGPFSGWSVGDFRDYAFEVFGNSTPGGSYSLEDIAETADNINQNYVDCTTDGGYLAPVCEPEPYCGDGEINRPEEECDGSAPHGFTCSVSCELDAEDLVCPLDKNDYDVIVEFDERLRSDLDANDAETSVLPLALDAGFYSVTLVGHDAYAERATKYQPNETYVLSFLDGATQIAQSSMHADLMDYVMIAQVTELVDTELEITSDIDGVQALHPFYPADSANSLNPVCAGITRNPYCGDGIIQNGEECDGSAPEGFTCTKTCELHELTYCGDGEKQSPNDALTGGPLDDGYEACDGESYCDDDCTYLDYTCVEALQAGLVSGSILGGQATITNNAPHAYDVGLAVYEKYDEIVANQVLYDHDTGIAPAFNSVELEVSLPVCAYQIDLFCGDVIQDFAEEGYYGNRKIDWEHNNDAGYCVDSFCGDGSINQDSEVCDDGDQNGIVCTPGYDSSCSYCSDTCELVDIPGPYCGDGIVQESEQCDGDAGLGDHQVCVSCDLVDLTYCGDGVKQSPNDELSGGPLDDGYEACDGSAPEGYWCSEACTLIEYCPLPSISHTYTGPVHEDVSVYINTVSRIVIELEENVSSECVDETLIEYDVTYVADEYCQSTQLCADSEHDIEWSAYEESFGLDAEGCYIVDYRVSDSNENEAGRACVFHDETPPVLEKIVGEPKEWWNGSNVFYPEAEDWCWSTEEGPECYTLTMGTPIEMSCSEEGAEQSGVAKICFEVGVDGDDYTPQYCETAGGSMENGACCVMSDEYTLTFEEESWHKLSFTCTDHVNKTSEADVEYFKVEQGSFEIELNKKWNLISVPFRLLNEDMEAVFDAHSDTIISVWGYNGTDWSVYTPDGVSNDDLNEMIPGYGYWVLTNDSDTLVIGGSLFSPAITPPSIEIVDGWNLLGYYGTEGRSGYYGPERVHGVYAEAGDTVSCHFNSFASSVLDEDTISVLSYWEPLNPSSWNTHHADDWGLMLYDRMDPGAGYWVQAFGEGVYTPTSTCGGEEFFS